MSRAPKKLALAIDAELVQDNMPSEIIPKLFIGSIHAAFNQEALTERGITHILNASRLPSTFPKLFNYLSIDIRDKDDANILSCIPAANIFIEAGIDAGGVLVHCYGGRSRSAALVAAFLMSSCGWDLPTVLTCIKGSRPVANINAGFEKQLRAYSQTNYDVYLAQQVLLRGRIRALAEYRTVVAARVDSKLRTKRSELPSIRGESKESKENNPLPLEDNNSSTAGQKRLWSAGSNQSKDENSETPRDVDVDMDLNGR
jgi:hypothetical protein